MSYSVYGYVYDSNGDAVEGVTVLPYFKKVDSGSSDSKWSDDKYTTDSKGYYSYSPEDSNILGSEGSYKKSSDKFYCAYMLGGGEDLDSLDLTDAMFHDHTIPNEDDIQIDITLLSVRKPIIDSNSLPDATLTQHEYVMSESSYTDTSWESADKGEDRSQKLIYDNIDIFDGHQLIDTVYTWDEVDDREISNNSSDKYTFQSAGDYTLRIRVREKWNTYTEVTKDVRVKYNEPNIAVTWDPTNDVVGNVEVTFTNSTNDLDDRTKDNYTFDWTLEDEDIDGNDTTVTFTDKDVDYQPKHTYDSAGSKKVTVKCKWNDGFDDLEVTKEYTVNVIEYDVTPKFEWNNPISRDDEVTITDKTDDPDDVMDNWDITINDYYDVYNPSNDKYGDETTDNTVTLEDNDEGGSVTHKFQAYDAHKLEMTVEYNTGWETKRKSIEYSINPSKYVVNAGIKTDPVATSGGWVGKVEVTYNEDCTGDIDQRISSTWTWNDKEEDDTEHITTREDEDIDKDEKFTFEYPSRKPYCAIDGATSANANKDVTVDVRYDDGWEDNIITSKTNTYEAKPNEISANITYETNIEDYTHG